LLFEVLRYLVSPHLSVSQYNFQKTNAVQRAVSVASCFQVAGGRITAALKSGGSVFAEYHKSIMTDLQQAEKENGLIYHVRVPEASTLGPIDKAVVAKQVAVSCPMSSNFTGE